MIPKNLEDQVNKQLKAEMVLKEISYRTDTIHHQEENIRCFCPIHKENIFRSLTVNVNRNTYKCGYTLCDGFRGSNLLDLYARAKGITRDESIAYWANKVGIKIDQTEGVPGTMADTAPAVFEKPTAISTPKLEVMIAQRLQELDNKPEDRNIRQHLAELYVKIKDIPSAVDHYIALALQCNAEGDNQNAISYLEQILTLDPTDNRAKKLLAQLSIQTGNRNRAIELWVSAAKSYTNAKAFQEAIEIYSQLVRNDPLETQWRYELSNILIKLERIPDAVRELKLLADFHIQRGQLQEAFSLYEKILSLTPQDLDVKKRAINTAHRLNQPERVVQHELDMVDSLLTSGNVNSAVESLHQALGESPGNIDLRKKLVDVLLQSGSTEEAVHQLGALAQLYIETNNQIAAAKTYQQLTGLQPQNMDLLEKMVALYEKLGYTKETVDVYSRIAALHLAQRAIEPAISALKRCLEIDPANTRMQNALANAYIREKSQTKATDVLISLAKKYQMDGDLDRARRSFDRILEFNPTALPAHEGLIEIYRTQNRMDMMVRHLCEIAEIYRQRNEFTPALLRIRQAIGLHTEKTEPLAIQAKIYSQIESNARAIVCYYKLSKTLASQQKLAEAVQATQQALSIDGNVAKVREQLANLYIHMGLKGDALSELRNLGITYEKNGRLDKAIDVLEKAKTIDPSNLTVLESLARLYNQQNNQIQTKSIYFALGKAFYEKGLLDDAIESYQRVLSLEPEHQEAISNLANAYLDVGATVEAIEQFRSLIVIYRTQHFFGEAIDLCKQILQLDSRNPEIHQILVDTYLEIGEQKEALTHLLILSDIYYQKQDFEKAAKTYQRVISISPSTLNAYLPLGDIYTIQKKEKEASNLYQEFIKLCQKKGMEEEIAIAYRKLVEFNPRDLTWRDKLAEHHQKNGQTMECLMEFDVIAGIYLEQKNYNKVIETYKKMNNLEPGNEDIARAIAQVEKLAKERI